MAKKKESKKIFSWSKKKIVIASLIAVAAVSILAVLMAEEKGEVSSTDFSSDLEGRITRTVSGYPIEEMAPFISKEDRTTAAYLVAIAKKESNWGKFSPQSNGGTCYNYWGYRGKYKQTDSGYSCFDSPQQAVEVVGKRIKDLIEKKADTPKKMALAWKCGWDCSGHSLWSVKKWEWDVNHYFKKVYN